ncbi:hypothetical protein LCGC14_1475280 [marine sediment metagenome]|uniref:Uncharacterized protein n=1 Tax=marine sediment metagenome TaxID=412755 RepID=A0A0F9MCT9_9ZZZZ
MITVICKDADSKTEEKNIYPCIKIHEDNGRKVLFVAPGDGYQIEEADGENNRGSDLMYHSASWVESLYTLYPGIIELKNA